METQTLNTRVMQHCESINLDEYRQSGEGGTAITYKHNSRNSLAKLYKSGFEADMVADEQLEEALAEGATAADLYRMACEDGGVDNVSVILARIK